MNNIIVYLLLYINILSLIVGYIVGRSADGTVKTNISKNKNIKQSLANDIKIDEKKIVIDINTKGLEKKYESLGEVSQVESDIGNSINKLKNLKR